MEGTCFGGHKTDEIEVDFAVLVHAVLVQKITHHAWQFGAQSVEHGCLRDEAGNVRLLNGQRPGLVIPGAADDGVADNRIAFPIRVGITDCSA